MLANRLGTVALTVLLLAGAEDRKEVNKLPDSARRVLHKAHRFELLSLDPDVEVKEGAKDVFHGYKVLGKTVVKRKGVRKEILVALFRGVAAGDTEGEPDCFNPRHGIRATYQGKTVDLVLCFECDQIMVYEGESNVAQVFTDGSPQRVFDKVLKDAGVPLAPKPKK
jgi:hypothetical protein